MKNLLVEELKNLNNALKNKYDLLNKFSLEEKREFLKKTGNLFVIEKMDIDRLKELKDTGGIVVVDGSTNRFGGAYPHYIQLFKAVASKGLRLEENIEITDIYCPLLHEGSIADEKNIVEKKLAEVELKIAMKAAEQNPRFIVMDGSLIRYRILCNYLWEKFKQVIIDKNIVLIGVIEDIKTSIIFNNIADMNSNNPEKIIYDREFIFNSLNYLEALYIDSNNTGKYNYGFKSSFFRSSQAPSAIAIDILEEQESELSKSLSLVGAITDINSRGIPFILDIVDLQARITNENIKELIKSYIDIEYYEKLFNAQRYKRSF